MSKEIVELLTKAIDKKFYLKRYNKKWQLSENNIDIEFKTPNCHSLGFSLDTKQVKDVFGFFSGRPPQGVAKMCDGIIALNYKEQAYIFLIEQKTSNSNGYRKQLINGWYFCQWLLSLLKEYKHYNGEIKYLGLLYRTRQIIYKTTSTHLKPEIKSEKNGIKFFETNDKLTRLKYYLKVI